MFILMACQEISWNCAQCMIQSARVRALPHLNCVTNQCVQSVNVQTQKSDCWASAAEFVIIATLIMARRVWPAWATPILEQHNSGKLAIQTIRVIWTRFSTGIVIKLGPTVHCRYGFV